MRNLRVGAVITRRELMTTRSQQIRLPDPANLVHLQFRRYAGCPFCNLHLRSFAQRHQQLAAAGIREVVVFQSPAADLLAQQGDVPFAVIPDPQRKLYAEFGVASSTRGGFTETHEGCKR
jgi:peroxiredoxin